MKTMNLCLLALFAVFTATSSFARTCSEVQKDLFQAANEVNTNNANGVAALQDYLLKAQNIRQQIDQALSDVGNSSSSQFPGMVIHYRFKTVVEGMFLDPMIQDLGDYSVRFLRNRQPVVNKINMLASELSSCTR